MQSLPLLSGAVARMLGVSTTAVRLYHDQHLCPRRSETGQRVYDRAIVEAYVAAYHARKAATP